MSTRLEDSSKPLDGDPKAGNKDPGQIRTDNADSSDPVSLIVSITVISLLTDEFESRPVLDSTGVGD